MAQAPRPESSSSPLPVAYGAIEVEPPNGIGNPLPIDAIPPTEIETASIPISEATGQPRRSIAMIVGICFLYAASIIGIAGYGWSWWQAISIVDFFDSSRLVGWWEPRPGSWQSIVAVVLVALLSLAMVAAPAISGFNAWNGYKWSRWAAVFSVLVCCLGLLINTISASAIAFALIGALVLFHPQVTNYFSHWQQFRAGTPTSPTEWHNVRYGRDSRFAPSSF